MGRFLKPQSYIFVYIMSLRISCFKNDFSFLWAYPGNQKYYKRPYSFPDQMCMDYRMCQQRNALCLNFKLISVPVLLSAFSM